MDVFSFRLMAGGDYHRLAEGNKSNRALGGTGMLNCTAFAVSLARRAGPSFQSEG